MREETGLAMSCWYGLGPRNFPWIMNMALFSTFVCFNFWIRYCINQGSLEEHRMNLCIYKGDLSKWLTEGKSENPVVHTRLDFSAGRQYMSESRRSRLWCQWIVRASREKTKPSFFLALYRGYHKKGWPRFRGVCLVQMIQLTKTPSQVCPVTWSFS